MGQSNQMLKFRFESFHFSCSISLMKTKYELSYVEIKKGTIKNVINSNKMFALIINTIVYQNY